MGAVEFGESSGLRRTWPQRFLIVSGTSLVVVCLAAAWGLWDTYQTVGSIAREALPEGVLHERTDDPAEPRNVLLIGTTENEGIAADDPLRASRADASLADTIMLLRVEPSTGQAIVMSINRDLEVPAGVAGYAGGLINGAYGQGQTTMLIEVINEYLGVDVHDFVKVNFAGFRSLIDELDGVPVYFPYAARDEGSFFSTDAGCQVLDGVRSLDYVRSRKYEIDEDGDGTFEFADTRTDYYRTDRQRDFLILMLDRAIEKGARNPSKLRDLVNAATDDRAVIIDEKLRVEDLIDIAQDFDDTDPDSLRRIALPVDEVPTSNGGTKLVLDEAQAQPYINIFRGHGETFLNENVTVKVVDARSDDVRAPYPRRPRQELSSTGIRVTDGGTAPAEERLPRSVLRYSPDQELVARQLVLNLAEVPEYQVVTALRTLTLHVGDDWAGVTLVPLPPADLAGRLPGDTPSTGTGTASTTTPPPADPGTADGAEELYGDGVIGRPPAGISCS